MTDSYPLVVTREFGRPQTRGGLFRPRLERSDDDLPALAPFHVRVFRIGDAYQEENNQVGLRDDILVNASSVTVVDKRARVPVVAEVPIPSGEIGDFTVRVKFLCTVHDAAAVVRDGVTDVKALLEGYVQGVPGLDEEGEGLPTSEAATVRKGVIARLQTYLEMRPPALSGFEIAIASVEVLSPEDMAEHLRALQEAKRAQEMDRFQNKLEAERAQAEHQMAQLKEDLAREKKLLQEQHRQELDRVTSAYDRLVDFQQQDDKLAMTAKQNDFARSQAARNYQEFGQNPTQASLFAMENNAISSGDFAQQLSETAERETAVKREEARLAREELRYLQDRVDRHWTLEYETKREDARLDREEERQRLDREARFRTLEYQTKQDEATASRLETNRRWEITHETDERRRVQDREDALTKRAEELDWREKVLQVQNKLIEMVIGRGHADDIRVDIDKLMNRIGEMPSQAAPQALGRVEGERDGRPDPVLADHGEEPVVIRATAQDSADQTDYDLGEAGLEERDGR